MTQKTVNNGVNIDALLAAREALKNAPEAARFTWRASCTWQKGTHATSRVEGFHGLGDEQSHRTAFSFETDHPEIFASEDQGATPVELVLVGLGELPHRRGCDRRAESRHPAAVGRGEA